MSKEINQIRQIDCLKNGFCRLTVDEIRAMNIPDHIRGLLQSPFHLNDDGTFVRVPRETFQRFTDVVAEYAQQISANRAVKVERDDEVMTPLRGQWRG